MRARHAALFFVIVALVWGAPVREARAAESVLITQHTTFSPGEYFFESLTVASSSTLTLRGDPQAPSFKGVIIHAQNLTIEPGSSISADRGGYGAGQGPGASTLSGAGASYGGIGVANTAASTRTYGSALRPTDLGSGGAGSGGGAMQLMVSDTLKNDGTVSADGVWAGSGGSILVNAGTLAGGGTFKARGGGLWATGYYKQPGGGGRIAIRYASSSFTGAVDVSGGCSGPSYAYFCAGDGTAGFIDASANALMLPAAWRFQTNDSPFSFTRIAVTGNGVTSDPGAEIATDELALDSHAAVAFGDDVRLSATRVSLDDASTLSFSGAADAIIGDLTISGGSTVTTALEHALTLSLANLTVSSGSRVDVSAKGYSDMQGPGAPPEGVNGVGASYGGIGSGGNTAAPVYGDADNPTDFGSGGYGPGGGALSLDISGTFVNDGTVSSDGKWSGSGGSILVHTHVLTGNGMFSANGAGKDSSSFLGPGGGGRIAIYADTAASSFSGIAEAKGACNAGVGYVYCGDDGTVVRGDSGPTRSSVLFLPGIEGSRLYMKDTEGREQNLWEPNTNSDIRLLAMTDTGASVNTVYTRDVIDSVWGWFTDVYGSFEGFMDDLAANGALKEWRAYPYDWRYDVFDIVDDGTLQEDGSREYLIAVVERMASSSPTGKVSVVAHSNGGLLAKALMVRLAEAGKESLVEKIVFVASPEVGTPEAVFSLLHGYNQNLGLGFVANAATVRAAAKNFPGVYGLLPSLAYFETVASPVANFNDEPTVAKYREAFGATLDTYDELEAFILNVPATRSTPKPDDLATPLPLNRALVEKAAATHALIDAWRPSPGTEIEEIVGWGNDTVADAIYTDKTILSCTQGSIICGAKKVLGYHTLPVIDGDGTVVSASASYLHDATYFNLADLNSGLFTKNYDHGNIFSSGVLRSYIEGALAGSQSSDTLRYFSDALPSGSGLRLVLVGAHSPVLISATDSAGRVTGIFPSPNAGSDLLIIKNEIPNSRVILAGEGKYLSLPEDTPVTIHLVGTGSGTVTLDTTDADDETLSSYENIPVLEGSIVETDLRDGSFDALAIDLDGDGAVDIETEGAPTVADTLALLKGRIVALRSLAVKNRLIASYRTLEKYARSIGRAAGALADMEKLARSQAGRTIPQADAGVILTLIQNLKNRR